MKSSTNKNYTIGIFFLLLFSILNLYGQSKNISPTKLADQFFAKYAVRDSPGVAVSVTKNGQTIYKKGFGIANLEYGVPISPTTKFHAASVSKQFTVFLILLLEKEGKLSIDDDIRKFLPELPDYGTKITLRNLANHTSGIRDNGDLSAMLGLSEDDSITNEQIVKLIARQKSLNFVPGSEFEYCNSGYILLAQIVERVSRKSFAEFAVERIFKPLKMNNTLFLDQNQKIVKNLAYSYSPEGTSFRKNLLNNSTVGSTGLVTTAEDLTLWALNFERITIGDSAIFNKMAERSTLNNGETLTYGLGLENKNYRGLDVIFHGGGIAAYRSYILRIPKEKFTVVVMSNSRSFNPIEATNRMVEYFLANKLKPQDELINKPLVKINKATLDSYVGNYEIQPGVFFSITNDGQNLILQGNGEGQKTVLRAISESEFLMSDDYNRISFYKRKGESEFSLKYSIYDFVYQSKRISIKPIDETKLNLDEFIGTYYSEELGEVYKIETKDNKLVAIHNRNEDIHFKGFGKDVFVTDQWFFKKVEFIRNQKLKIVACKVSGARAKEILFKKI